MRINPSEKAIRGKELSEKQQAQIQKITRIVALVVAFIGTYFFVVKILFF